MRANNSNHLDKGLGWGRGVQQNVREYDAAMATSERSLADLYRGWDVYQGRLAAAIAPLNGPQLDLSAAPHLWSIRMLGLHVIAARSWWFHSWMGGGRAAVRRAAGLG